MNHSESTVDWERKHGGFAKLRRDSAHGRPRTASGSHETLSILSFLTSPCYLECSERLFPAIWNVLKVLWLWIWVKCWLVRHLNEITPYYRRSHQHVLKWSCESNQQLCQLSKCTPFSTLESLHGVLTVIIFLNFMTYYHLNGICNMVHPRFQFGMPILSNKTLDCNLAISAGHCNMQLRGHNADNKEYA